MGTADRVKPRHAVDGAFFIAIIATTPYHALLQLFTIIATTPYHASLQLFAIIAISL